jgi:hypothetical protein
MEECPAGQGQEAAAGADLSRGLQFGDRRRHRLSKIEVDAG